MHVGGNDYNYKATFDSQKYYQILETELGKNLFHYNTISSTMDYFNDQNDWKNTENLEEKYMDNYAKTL